MFAVNKIVYKCIKLLSSAGLGGVVRGDVESELIHTSHTHSLLIGQLLQQAEHWHLTMTADISSLENKSVKPVRVRSSPHHFLFFRELLEALAQYEQQQFSSTASAAGIPNAVWLVAVV